MTTTIDHIIIAVSDLAEASAEYSALLGREPSWRGATPITAQPIRFSN
ncbi:MAG: hypothetical protein CM15mP74_16460 [Halieaceae bacterium]|nr:MAG: hypothetical protein CM15mP74_16460 [Halieaceae bacterium]